VPEAVIPLPVLSALDDDDEPRQVDEDDLSDQTDEFPAEDLPPEADEFPADADLDERDLDGRD
jgi:hypothetical protein